MGGWYQSRVDHAALAKAVARPGSNARYQAFLGAVAWLVHGCRALQGKGELRPPQPSRASELVLLAARFQPGSFWHGLPTPVLELILDAAFRRIQPAELRALLPELEAVQELPRWLQRLPQPQEVALCVVSAKTGSYSWAPRVPSWLCAWPLRLADVSVSCFEHVEPFLGLSGKRPACPLALAIVHTFQHAFPGVFTAQYQWDVGVPGDPLFTAFSCASPGWMQEHANIVVCAWHGLIDGRAHVQPPSKLALMVKEGPEAERLGDAIRGLTLR